MLTLDEIDARFPPPPMSMRAVADRQPEVKLPAPSPPQPPVVKPPNPAIVHARRSVFVVLGCYVILGLMALVTAAVSGVFPHISATILLVLVALAPILAVGGKDYLHWVQTGEWNPPEMLAKIAGPKV